MNTKASAVGHEMVLQALSKKQHVIEIGFYNGWSAQTMLDNCASLTSVDINECPHHAAFLDNPKFRFVRGSSQILAPEPCDFLFIDGDHSYAAVLSDLMRWGVLARKHIALHDSARPQASGVRTAIFAWLSMNHDWHVVADILRAEGLMVLRNKQWRSE
jgi:predicted O-methyltransferase YrrM